MCILYIGAYAYIKKQDANYYRYKALCIKTISLNRLVITGIAIAVAFTCIEIAIYYLHIWANIGDNPDKILTYYGMVINGDKLQNKNEAFDIWTLLIVIAVNVLIVATFEELFFRELLLNTLIVKYKLPLILAVGMASAIFAVPHLPNKAISAFVFGLLASVLYIKYQNILFPIVIHGVGNSLLLLWKNTSIYDFHSGVSVTEAQRFGVWLTPTIFGVLGVFVLIVFAWFALVKPKKFSSVEFQ